MTDGRDPIPRPPHSSPWAYALGIAAGLAILSAAGYAWRASSAPTRAAAQPDIGWEARVRTEPPGLAVELDGQPLGGDSVRFLARGPFGRLTARQGCRTAEHELQPADAGGEIVLVPDPAEIEWPLDLDPAGASVRVNGEDRGVTPADLRLDLCRDNRLDLAAEGYRAAGISIPAGATPIEARTLLAGLALERIPVGQLSLPALDVPVVYFVDGRRVGRPPLELELAEGGHEVRWTNAELWIDSRATAQVVAGRTVGADARSPGVAKLVVQAYPPSCKVYLRRPGGSWTYLDETPLEQRIAAGRYEVRVELAATGETRERTLQLRPGSNPPLRVAFGGAG